MASRQPLAKQIERAESLVGELKRQLEQVAAMSPSIATALSLPTEEGSRCESSFYSLALDANSLLGSMARARRRLQRPRLQIGVFGRAGQGKSTLLQVLTGLSDSVIPSGNIGHCTGARSLVVHDESAAQPWADIKFLTEQQFLETIIHPYFQSLKLPISLPTTVDDFQNQKIVLPETDRADHRSKFNHLDKYQRHLSSYRDLLSAAPRQVSADQIRQFVAQEDVDGQHLHWFRAVASAEIHCRFPLPDVTGLAFADMPGLGDTALGNEADLLRSLAEDVDLILLMKKPEGERKVWHDFDVQLYDVAGHALGEFLPAEAWVWLVLNDDGRNQDHFCFLKDLLEQAGIRVAGVIEANCSKLDDVQKKLLDPLLTFLEQHLTAIDRCYLAGLQKKLNLWLGNVQTAVSDARRLCPSTGTLSEIEWPIWQKCHDDLMESLQIQMTDLVDDLKKQQHEPDIRFDEALQAVLKPCWSREDSTLVPTADEFERRIKQGNPLMAMGQCMEFIRSRLTRRFCDGLDASLSESFDAAKERAVAIFCEQHLVEAQTAEQGLAELADLALEAGAVSVLRAVEFLRAFRLTYFGFLHHRIRQHLAPLTPNEKQMPPFIAGEQADAVKFLWDSIGEVAWNIQQTVKQLAFEPSMSRFAMVEEFRDQLLRHDETRDDWRKLTRRYRERIWPEKFAQVTKRHRQLSGWTTVLQSLAMIARDPALQFAGAPPPTE